MQLDKIKDRIRKLLRMAGDTSSPNEAAIAADRAARLLKQHQLDHADVILDELDDPDQLIETKTDKVYRRTPGWLQSLAVSIAKATDTQVRFRRTADGNALTYQGYKPDVELAEWLLDYLFTQVGQLADHERKLQKREPCFDYLMSSRRYMTSFREGLGNGIRRKLAEFYRDGATDVSDTARALVTAKENAIAQQFGEARYGTRRGAGKSRSGYSSGAQAAAHVNVSRAMGSSSRASGPALLGKS